MGTKKNRLISLFLATLAIVGITVSQTGDVGAASLKSEVQIRVTGTLSNVLDFGQVDAPLRVARTLELTTGTGANQANTVWSDQRTLGSGASEDLDLAGGGLTDPLGVAFAPAKVRAIAICSSATNTVNLTLFGDANSVPFLNTAATTVTLQPGGCWLHSAPASAGVAVTAGTGDIVQIANGAGTTVYDIVVIGTTS